MYINVTFLAVLLGCEILSVIVREEHRLGMLQSKCKRRFGLNRKEVIRDWRKLHNEELRHY
jgi:hypothetical protein